MHAKAFQVKRVKSTTPLLPINKTEASPHPESSALSTKSKDYAKPELPREPTALGKECALSCIVLPLMVLALLLSRDVLGSLL